MNMEMAQPLSNGLPGTGSNCLNVLQAMGPLVSLYLAMLLYLQARESTLY